MKILFLLSSLEPAGSETYCTALADQWGSRHEIHWISDRLHFGQTYTSMPISHKALPWGQWNVVRVAGYVKRHGIQVIHSHSRRAHWTAAQAAFWTGAAHVTTVHQPLPVHIFSRLFPCFGDMTIAIDEAVADHLLRRFHLPPKRVRLVRNGISLSQFSPSLRDNPGQKKILIIGRLSGGRWEPLQFFLKTLESVSRQLPPALYQIVGRIPDDRQAGLQRQLALLNSRIAPSRVDVLGFIQDLAVAIRNADAVIGAGRSALESLANARPVILLGEGGTLGLCEPASWRTAMHTNMGDHLSPKQFNPAILEAALRRLLSLQGATAELARWGRAQVEQHYNLAVVAQQVERVYEAVIKS